MFAASEAWARLVPTSEAWDVLRRSPATWAARRPGVRRHRCPPSPGLVLLAVGGVGPRRPEHRHAVRLRALATAGGRAAARAVPRGRAHRSTAVRRGGRSRCRPPAGCSSSPPTSATASGAGADSRRRRASAACRRAPDAPASSRSSSRRSSPSSCRCAGRCRGTPAAGPEPARRPGTASGPVILDPLVSMRRSLIQANDTEVLTYDDAGGEPVVPARERARDLRRHDVAAPRGPGERARRAASPCRPTC